MPEKIGDFAIDHYFSCIMNRFLLIVLLGLVCPIVSSYAQVMQPGLIKSPEFKVENSPDQTGEIIAVNSKYIVYMVKGKKAYTFITFDAKTMQEQLRWAPPVFEGYDFAKSKLSLKMVLQNTRLVFEYQAFAVNNSIWQQFIFSTDFEGTVLTTPSSIYSIQENSDSLVSYQLQELMNNRFLMVQFIKTKQEKLSRVSAWLLDKDLRTDRYYSFVIPQAYDMHYLGAWVSEDELDNIHFASFFANPVLQETNIHHLRITTIGSDGGMKRTWFLPLHNKAFPVGGSVQINNNDVWIFGYYNQPKINTNYLGTFCFKVSTDINLIRLAHQNQLDSAIRAEFWNPKLAEDTKQLRRMTNYSHSIDKKKRITMAVDYLNYQDLQVPGDLSTAKRKITEKVIIHRLDSNGVPLVASAFPALQTDIQSSFPQYTLGCTTDTVIIIQTGRNFIYKGNNLKNIYAGRQDVESEDDMMLVTVPTKKGKYYSRLFPLKVAEFGKTGIQTSPLQYGNQIYTVVRKGKPKSYDDKCVLFKLTI